MFNISVQLIKRQMLINKQLKTTFKSKNKKINQPLVSNRQLEILNKGKLDFWITFNMMKKREMLYRKSIGNIGINLVNNQQI